MPIEWVINYEFIEVKESVFGPLNPMFCLKIQIFANGITGNDF